MQSDRDRLQDKVYSAMETGNHAEARLVLAEHADTFPVAVARVWLNVHTDYGVAL